MRKYLVLLFAACSLHAADNRVFKADNWITVPDGTRLSPFFNPKDCTSGLPWDLLDTVSLAMGEVATESSIHIMPLVTQITFVLSGSLEVVIKEPDQMVAVTHTLKPQQAVLTKPGSFFQLRNKGSEPCRVLYIVSPAYLFELDETQGVVYDDSFIVEETWQKLESLNWKLPSIPSQEKMAQARQESYMRLSSKAK
ncbi:MAG: cupin domain-containing protein [Verrucomicrobia bacterium]|nr:cupin domain-containing protein [Verrucomicrobiota bacterium]MBS0637285.1 cupin domain-containing protein [Verrucomicrobiota bacterium]